MFTGPLKKKVEHLKELDHHPDDDEKLPQASRHEARVYLTALPKGPL